MAKVIRYLPELEGDEQLYIATLMKDMSEEQAEQFSHVYRQRRKDPTLTLVTALAGFVGFAGIHRFLMNQIGMGLLYFFIGGLCLIGTIVDMVNFKSLTYQFNQKQALDVAMLIRATISSPEAPRRLGE